MPPIKHATLSASSSERWIQCPPSALLNAQVEDTGSVFAEEGTAAHALCEAKVRRAAGISNDPDPHDEMYYNEEMEECAEGYKEYVMEQLSIASDPSLFIEQHLDFSEYVPQGFGTGDCVIISDGVLHIIDFKYGKGVEVNAEKNPQLMCYALGALAIFSELYDISQVRLTIYQPRKSHIDTWETDVGGLIEWATRILKPAAELAIKGEGDFCAGDHCRFCKVKATCRARAEYNLTLARYDFAMPAELTQDEIEIILDRATTAKAWLDDIQEYALQQALAGAEYKRYKVVEGRSNRKYRDEQRAAELVLAAGYDPFKPKEIKGLTDMEKTVGKKKLSEILSDCIYKPKGKPVLVPITDKRPPYVSDAADDFKEGEV